MFVVNIIIKYVYYIVNFNYANTSRIIIFRKKTSKTFEKIYIMMQRFK